MIPKLAPTITETVNTGYTQGVKDSMIFKSEAAFEDFIGVLVDGEVLDTNEVYFRYSIGTIQHYSKK